MAANDHLTFAEIRDFTPGLWTVGDWLMPPNSAQVMNDCYPLPGGGIRAFFKPTTISTTGIVNIAQEAVIGVHARGGIGFRSGGAGDASDYYLATYNSTTNIVRLYRMDLTAGATSWTLLKAFAAVAAVPNAPTWADYYLTGSAVNHVEMSLYQTSTDDGVWSINYADGVMAKIASAVGPVCIHQSRLIIANSDLNGKIIFSDPGTENFGAQSTITTEPSRQLSVIMWIQSFSPSDLLLGKRGAPFMLVEGDLSNYQLRTMSDAKNVGYIQTPAFGPSGIIYIAKGDGVYETLDGQMHTPISTPISPAQFNTQASGDVGSGDLAFLTHWLFAPHGLIRDYDTGAWFQSSFISSDSFHLAVDRGYGRVIAATDGTNFTLYKYSPIEGQPRAESWTYKSSPLRAPDGRQIEIREVQVYARTYNSSTSTITVTVNGVAITKSITDPNAKDMLAFFFAQRDEVLDVTVTAASNASGVEAPTVEAIRIGSRSGHLSGSY